MMFESLTTSLFSVLVVLCIALASFSPSVAASFDAASSVLSCPTRAIATQRLQCHVVIRDASGNVDTSAGFGQSCDLSLAVCPPAAVVDAAASYIPNSKQSVKFRSLGHFDVAVPVVVAGVNKVSVRFRGELVSGRAVNVTVTPGVEEPSKTVSTCAPSTSERGEPQLTCNVTRHDAFGNVVNLCEHTYDAKNGAVRSQKCGVIVPKRFT